MSTKLTELKNDLRRISDLAAVAELLEWDQSTYMPPEGAVARGRHLALVSRLRHEVRVSPRMRDLLSGLSAVAEQDDADGALVRLAKREYDRAACLPADFVAEISEHQSASYAAWSVARPANDFAALRPMLEKTLELSRRTAELLPPGEHLADSLVDAHDRGSTTKSLLALFGALREVLVPLVKAIAARPEPPTAFLREHYPKDAQDAFGREVVTALGYDFDRGRLDETLHPFMTRFSVGDVRITTRYQPNDVTDGLFSSIHEAGHALYEQGILGAYDGSPLGGGASSGVHESQSRLWENIVGRSLPFWRHFYPGMQKRFARQLGDVSLEDFHRAINVVRPSLIRTDADEVTYNLHVMLRFDLEIRMLEGKLKVADLPDAWNARIKSDLGVDVPDDRDGCMQDVHWYAGLIGGMFQGYTLGNVMSGQFWQAALEAHPEIPEELGRGEFGPLRAWLTETIYQHGSRYEPLEIVERVTGKPLGIEAFASYLRDKYGALYLLGA